MIFDFDYNTQKLTNTSIRDFQHLKTNIKISSMYHEQPINTKQESSNLSSLLTSSRKNFLNIQHQDNYMCNKSH